MSRPKKTLTALDHAVGLDEQLRATRELTAAFGIDEQLRAMRELPAAFNLDEQLRATRELLPAPFEPMREAAEAARASMATFDRGGLAELAAGIAEGQTAISALVGPLIEQEKVSRAFLGTFDAIGGIAEQTRALRALGSASENLTAILEREDLAMLNRERLIQGSLASISRSMELSICAQDRIAALPFESIGRLADFDAVARGAAATRFSAFAESYQGLTGWISRDVGRAWELPDFVTERPARELLASADLLRVLSTSETIESPPNDDADVPLPELLAELHPRLPSMLHGARRVLRDAGNPDRERQAATSIVELWEHALQQAAPDDQVKPWAGPGPEHYLPDGRLKRSARWAYLTRNIHGAAGRFDPVMEASVTDMVGIIKELQNGKHRLEPSLRPALIKVLLIRVDGALRTLYIVWKCQRR